ncbi:MAG TPA: Gfo/Idh/MocA family oxidoreductase [Roseiarcus sp.]|jgi:predicted dehydrogenase|nr:Gfo/Idh/MocA family oxidoreductase [Roseiarcus sp.]
MQSARIKIGLVGAGAIMRLGHAPTIKASAEAELVAVFDADVKRAEAIAKEFGGKPFDNLEAMLDVAGLDAVIVATPNKFHEEGVVAAAKHGKHVLCEKPLTIDAAGARRVVKACEDAKVILQVGFNQRFWAQVEIAKQLIQAGFIGKVHQMRSIYSEKSTAYPASTRYRYNLEQSGGATIIDLTIHRIDLARHLVGDFSGVFGELIHSALPELVDDNVFLLARFSNGARGSLASNRYSPNIGDGTDLFGTEGTIHIASETASPFASAPLAVYTERPAADLPDVLREAHYPEAWWKSFEGGWITVKPPRQSPYRKQFAAFCESIREGKAAKISGFDGLRAQEFVQGAYLSMRSGTWVDLPLAQDAPFVVPQYS